MKKEKVVKQVVEERKETESFTCDHCGKVFPAKHLPDDWCHVEVWTSYGYESYGDEDIDFCSPECLIGEMDLYKNYESIDIETTGKFIMSLIEYVKGKPEEMQVVIDLEKAMLDYVHGKDHVDERIEAFQMGVELSKKIKSGWISTAERLPEEGKYVLAIHNRGTWHDSTDQEHVNFVIVKLIKGLSKSQREFLPDYDLRKRLYKAEDEEGNNLKPYNWTEFGPNNFFGQDITHWMPLPEAPEKNIDIIISPDVTDKVITDMHIKEVNESRND